MIPLELSGRLWARFLADTEFSLLYEAVDQN